MTRRPCRKCGRNRSARFFVSDRATVCTDCRTATRRATGRANKVAARYGLSRDDHAGLVALQGGVCAICLGSRRYPLAVDHDHTTGAVRGLCCKRCNKLLAMVQDDAELLLRAVEYLRQPPFVLLGAARGDGPEAA